MTPQPGKIKDARRSLAMLGGLCLFLSAIEYLIPKPLPFMRIGLANLPLLLALNLLGPKDFFLLVTIKILGQGIISGTLFSYVFLFSVAGTLSSAALMYVLRRLAGERYLGYAGIGCAGAMTSNAVQLVLARYCIFGPALRYMIPPFLVSGFASGIILGLLCEYFCRRSRWYAFIQSGDSSALSSKNSGQAPQNGVTATLPSSAFSRFNAEELFVTGLLMALIFIFSRSLPLRTVQLLFFYLLARLSGKKINLLITLIIMAGIVFFNLLSPYGKILFSIGPLHITQGALLGGLDKAINLEGLLILSRACIRSDLGLPGTIGSLLGESLRMTELMREKKHLIRRGHISEGIDQLLLETEMADAAIKAPKETIRSVKNYILLCIMVLLTAAIGFLPEIRCLHGIILPLK